jgi:hypothetical protein
VYARLSANRCVCVCTFIIKALAFNWCVRMYVPCHDMEYTLTRVADATYWSILVKISPSYICRSLVSLYYR